jgi:hypothetical protein
MDHHSSAPAPDSVTGSPGDQADRDGQRERLRAELLAAAEQEAASILEDARREITVTARRAHRDLLLIRAQLRLCGIDPGQIGASGLDPSYLEAAGATDDGDTATPVAQTIVREDPVATTVPTPPLRPSLTKPSIIAAAAVAIVVAGGAVGWYAGRDDTSATRTAAQPAPQRSASAAGRSAAAAGAAVDGRTTTDQATADVAPDQKPANVANASQITLRTTRPVWMRVDVDGSSDIGRTYAAGETRVLTPRQLVSIRAGDAGAVLLGIGGGAPAPLGADGQVITRRIPATDASSR